MRLAAEIVAAVLLIVLTLWLQCGGLALLIIWARRAVRRNIDKMSTFRIATLIVRITTAIVALHVGEILLWACWYRWACITSWEVALYFSASSYSTVGYGDVTLPPRWRLLGPVEGLIGVLMCGVSVSFVFVLILRLVERAGDSSKN